jgi:hypothetical protein
MPRYFFHFVSKEDFIPDHDGMVLRDLKTAHLHAMRLVTATIPALGDEDLRTWKIEIADERQYTVLTVLFPVAPPPPIGPEPTRAGSRTAPKTGIDRRDTVHLR